MTSDVTHEKGYKIVSGTAYHKDTPDDLIRVLERIMHRTRIVVDYTYIDEYERFGYVGRSTGRYRVPLLVYNERSTGGPQLSTNEIVRIRTSKGRELLWQLPDFVTPKVEVVTVDRTGQSLPPEYTHSVLINGEVWGNCCSLREANNLAKKMS